MTLSECAKDLGVNHGTVYYMAQVHDITFKNSKKAIRAQIKADAESGLTAAECAKKRGKSIGAVYAMASRLGVKFRNPRHEPETAPVVANNSIPEVVVAVPSKRSDRSAKMWRMHEAGHPAGVIAMYCGMTRGDVIAQIKG
ncbi:hypothetical protein [Sagittula sp. MA-2]|uniref:hypothetical protein n=1 Tax=Sagittula sp. MA-2 TaxID=3048007 RepID=UPI0024C42CDC|nr:hypothetical protein [Sagittula sp. MA-2]WHZ35742.1 hypothetical protein QNI11_01760 [Sagittula sp. MA-2]